MTTFHFNDPATIHRAKAADRAYPRASCYVFLRMNEQIIEMYKKGEGTATIAFKLKLSARTVQKVVKQAGIMRERKASLKISHSLRASQKRKPV